MRVPALGYYNTTVYNNTSSAYYKEEVALITESQARKRARKCVVHVACSLGQFLTQQHLLNHQGIFSIFLQLLSIFSLSLFCLSFSLSLYFSLPLFLSLFVSLFISFSLCVLVKSLFIIMVEENSYFFLLLSFPKWETVSHLYALSMKVSFNEIEQICSSLLLFSKQT